MSTNRKLLIASPAKGGLPTFLFLLMDRLHQQPIQGWSIDWCVESANAILNLSRNVLANEAVVSTKGFDAMLMLDTDEQPSREHIERILSHDLEKNPIISGMYCMKRPGKPFFLGIREKGAQPDDNSVLKASFLPTGFLRVSTDALRKMQAHHADKEFYIQDDHAFPPGPRPTRQTMVELFPFGVRGPRTPHARFRRVKEAIQPIINKGGVSSASRPLLIESMQKVIEACVDQQPPGNLLGEDFYFSRLATEAGIPQFFDLACMVPHYGGITYPITDPAVLATTCDGIPEQEGDQTTW